MDWSYTEWGGTFAFIINTELDDRCLAKQVSLVLSMSGLWHGLTSMGITIDIDIPRKVRLRCFREGAHYSLSLHSYHLKSVEPIS